MARGAGPPWPPGRAAAVSPLFETDARRPDPLIDEQSVRLELPDASGACSYMDMASPDILGPGYTKVTVRFDIYRQTDNWISSLWWWWFDTGVASGYFDGNLLTTVNISGIDTLTGWAIRLGHDEGAGSGPDVARIDNFIITAVPEPAPLTLPGLGLAALLRRR